MAAESTKRSAARQMTIRRSDERGHADFGWLRSRHSFSFGEYYDPAHMGFRSLRVINEARGFGMHPHDNMEILSYVVEGTLEHKDSMGTGSVIRRGEVQCMSAGTGVRHSEFNPSEADPVHFLQIWIVPEQRGLPPRYQQRRFDLDAAGGGLTLIASRDGRDGSLTIQQDVNLYAGRLAGGESVSVPYAPGRHAWVQVVSGTVRLQGESLAGGDAAAISPAGPMLDIQGAEDAEFLVFDLR